MNITHRFFESLKYGQTLLGFAITSIVAAGCSEKGVYMFKEEAILGRADAALMRKCRLNTVRVERRAKGSAYELRDTEGKGKGLPMLHTGGEVSYQEQIFGEEDIRIKIQFRGGSLVRAEVQSRELYKEACQEWANTVRSALPTIEIVFLEREN